VIAGEFRGRSIETVSNHLTRPTSDKVKESLFNIIGPYFNDGTVLDLFAGSGGLGIEALSRGMGQAIFIDQQKRAIQMIKKNLSSLEISDRAEVYQNDAFRALKVLGKRKLKFELIFIDPPYKKDVYQRILKEISREQLTYPNTMIICEHDSEQSLPESITVFDKKRTEKYGGTTGITLYQRKDNYNE